MLRSFAYAAQVGLAAVATRRARRAGAGRAPIRWAERWETGSPRGLSGWRTSRKRGNGVPAFLPTDRDHLVAALRVFELDKAVYELHYELNHRPAWVRIPLEGLRKIVTAAPAAEPARAAPGRGPFGFVACFELREFLGVRAENERRLAELIDEVPLDSIYYHTHGFFLRHKFVAGTYPNDFATWAAVQVRDRVLGERLAMVDPSGFTNLHDLREELVSDHRRSPAGPPDRAGRHSRGTLRVHPIAHRGGAHRGSQVRTLQEFRDALLTVDVSAIYFHLIEARLRLGRGQNDFAAWVEHGLGLPDLAATLRAVDPYAGSLERARSRTIQICDEALTAGVRTMISGRLDDYREVAPQGSIDLLVRLADRVRGRRFLHVERQPVRRRIFGDPEPAHPDAARSGDRCRVGRDRRRSRVLCGCPRDRAGDRRAQRLHRGGDAPGLRGDGVAERVQVSARRGPRHDPRSGSASLDPASPADRILDVALSRRPVHGPAADVAPAAPGRDSIQRRHLLLSKIRAAPADPVADHPSLRGPAQRQEPGPEPERGPRGPGPTRDPARQADPSPGRALRSRHGPAGRRRGLPVGQEVRRVSPRTGRRRRIRQSRRGGPSWPRSTRPRRRIRTFTPSSCRPTPPGRSTPSSGRPPSSSTSRSKRTSGSAWPRPCGRASPSWAVTPVASRSR